MIYICMFGVPVLLSWSLYKFRIKEMSLADNIVVVFSLFFLQNFCTCFISSCRGCIGFSFHEMTNTYIAKYVALSSVIGIVIVLLLKRLHSSYIHTYKCISATSRNGTIDFMKFVFSIIIVLFHSAKFFEEHNRIFINGRIGVEFFFLVSGYLMAKNSQYYMKEKSIGKATKDFLLKKIKGMCPEVYVAFIFAFLVVHMISDISLCKLIKDLINSIFSLLFLGMGGLHGYDPNGNTWYISAMLLSMLILLLSDAL